ncbi:MAG: hypothetical protein R6V17_01285 [Halanaerobacter sp.]
MNLILLIYLTGLVFNLLFTLLYWYRQRRVLKINYLGTVVFVLLSWLVFPLILIGDIVQNN